jgi:hypothetical protein
MKKIKFLALLLILSLSVSPVLASTAKSATTSTELSKEEANSMISRVAEIREMDKSNLTANEKSELKSELKEIKETMKSAPYIYIGGSTLLILIIVLIILL